jgi:soluble lytic murein transglycosylase
MSRPIALAIAFLMAAPGLPLPAARTYSPPARGYWLQPVPGNDVEAAVHTTLTDPSLAGKPEAAQALRDLAAQHPGGSAAGLARLAAGLLLLDNQQYADAEPLLLDPEIGKTRLEDYAWKALAELYEKTGAFSKSADEYDKLAGRADPNPFRCGALLRGAELKNVTGARDEALKMLQRALAECPGREAQALLQTGSVQQQRGDLHAAAEAFDRLDRDYPATAQGRDAALRLRTLAPHLGSATPQERLGHDLKKALVLFEAGEHATAVRLFQALLLRKPPAADADLIRVRLGRALLARDRDAQARVQFSAVKAGSAVEPEAAYHLARLQTRRGGTPAAYDSVAKKFPGTPWAEEALLDAAFFYAREGKDDEALPYWRRLYEQYPQGRYADPAAFRVGWGEFRAGHFDTAAEIFEAAAKARGSNVWRPAFLYWAGRAQREGGHEDQARALFEDVLLRYKHAYHGLRARAALGRLPGGASSTNPAAPEGLTEVPEPYRTRVRNLLLIERLDDAMAELTAAPLGPQVQATRSWIFWRQHQLRPAITAMKRAYPEWVTELGEQLPDAVWQILFPLQFADLLTANATEAGVDPALVAAVIQQESTFDPTAVSGAGAHGLMQLMPPTGRALARDVGVRRLTVAQLHDPAMGLKLGTRYLKEMIDRFGGKVERALAAYNAGPHRVAVWNLAHPGLSAEEFVDTIPFNETRVYVMTILAAQAQYRRIYALPAGPGSAGYAAGGRP